MTYYYACNPEPGIKGSDFVYSEGCSRQEANAKFDSERARFRAAGFTAGMHTMAGCTRRSEIRNKRTGECVAIIAVVPFKLVAQRILADSLAEASR